MFRSFPQLIVCAAMYKLTPQYIVSYDQVNNCLSHVYWRERGGGGGAAGGREIREEVSAKGMGRLLSLEGIFIGLFCGISRPSMLCLSALNLLALN